jgi:hypothetical protein
MTHSQPDDYFSALVKVTPTDMRSATMQSGNIDGLGDATVGLRHVLMPEAIVHRLVSVDGGYMGITFAIYGMNSQCSQQTFFQFRNVLDCRMHGLTD